MPSQTSEAIVSALLLRIMEARKNAGMSQEQLSELSGIDLGIISRAERLQRIPGMSAILDMAQVFDFDLPALLGAAIEDSRRESGSGTHAPSK